MYSFLDKKGKIALIVMVLVIAGVIIFGLLSFLVLPGGLFWMISIPPYIILCIAGGYIYYLITTRSPKKNKRIAMGGIYAAACIVIVILMLFPYVSSRSWSALSSFTINKVEISGNGSKLVAIIDGDINCYDSNTRQLLWTNYTTPNIVTFSTDGKYLLATTTAINLYDTSNGNLLFRYDIGSTISKALISSDGSNYVILDGNGHIYYFEKSNPTPKWIYSSTTISGISMSSNGYYITAKSGQTLYLFNSTSNSPIWSTSTGSTINSLDMADNGNYMIAGCQNGYFYVYQKESPINIYNYQLNSYIIQVKISPDGENAVAITERYESATYLTIYQIKPLINSVIRSDQWFDEDTYTTYEITEDCLHMILGVLVINTRTRDEAGPYYSTYSFYSGAIVLADIVENRLAGGLSYSMYHHPTDLAISDDNSLVVYCGQPRTDDNPGSDGLYLYDFLLNNNVINAAIIIYITLPIAISVIVIIYGPKIKPKKRKQKFPKQQYQPRYKKTPSSLSQSPKNTIACSQCGAINIMSSNFCINCGSNIHAIDSMSQQSSSSTIIVEKKMILEPNRCPHCGNMVPEGNAICWKCFKSLK